MARSMQAMAGSGAKRRIWGSLNSGDFAALLAAAPIAKTTHFVLQHLPACPASAFRHHADAVVPELSTVGAPTQADSVDNTSCAKGWWLGLVVPKRHAKRAVTRNLLKRQMRAAVDRDGPRMLPGQWVVRLRAPFDARLFPSAASVALRQAASRELKQLLARVVAA
jgi:ribonuclease P protein component